MNNLLLIKDKLISLKMSYVKNQLFYLAAYTRDIEIHLDKVINKENTVNNFIKYVMYRKTSGIGILEKDYLDIYTIIKPLERSLKLKQLFEKN